MSRNDGYSNDACYDKNYHNTSRNRGYSYDETTNGSAPHDSSGNRHSTMASSKSADIADDTNVTALDEFGRVKSLQPKKVRWPPCFETNGSAFVLDTRSGMFYESISDFFYDPKSKLYYGNKQSAYFQYDPIKLKFINLSENKPEPEDGQGNTTTDSMEPLSTSQPPEIKKASITINLKTKLLASTKPNKKSKRDDGSVRDKPSLVVPEPVAVPKQHALNIEKWSVRQNEIRQQEQEGKSKLEDDSTKIVATAKGEPICLLCRRRFPNVDKLRHHEEVSTLHKENLAKQALSATEKKQENADATTSNLQPPTVVSASYVDRAEQRRQLHQVETMNTSSVRTLNSDVHSIVSADTNHSRSGNVVETKNILSATLDESNIGHQMLQKLGWKAGNVLGKKSDGNDTRNDSERPEDSSTTASRIAQDWDRIEAASKLSSSQRGISMNTVKKGIGH
jgi:OCRE domain/G-patch domain